MAGRFRALTCAQEPRCSRHDSPALAACPQGFLSSAMAVPHSDSRRRKAAVSLVLALFASSKALMDAAMGAALGAPMGAAVSAPVGAAMDAPIGAPAGAAAGPSVGGFMASGIAATDAGASVSAARGALLPNACKGKIWCCHSCQPAKA